jgi:hypothetical protein
MTTSLSTNRRDVDGVQPFHAPASLFQDLQRVLVDLIELHGVSVRIVSHAAIRTAYLRQRRIAASC